MMQQQLAAHGGVLHSAVPPHSLDLPMMPVAGLEGLKVGTRVNATVESMLMSIVKFPCYYHPYLHCLVNHSRGS